MAILCLWKKCEDAELARDDTKKATLLGGFIL
jgi:hypothetical protein